MTINFKHHVIEYVIDIVTLCGEKTIELEKRKEIIPAKDKWQILSIITLIPIVGFNHLLPILHLSKRMVHIYGK